ncbi:MAG: response regulator [Myxococcaceae bacterium]
MKPLDKTASQTATERPTVLYVEDDEENWETTKLRLGARYNVLWAKNDLEFFSLIHAHGPRIRVILMDIQLRDSELSGIQLTRWLRGKAIQKEAPKVVHQLAPNIPILFVTAAGAQYTDKYLLSQGGSEVITKPVDFTKLSLALARVCLANLGANVERRSPAAGGTK